MYDNDEKFPCDVILFKDILKVILPPAPHHKIHSTTPSTKQRENIKAYDTDIHGPYNKAREVVITKIQQTMYKNDCLFVAALKKNIKHQRYQLVLSNHTKLITTSFAAAHPQEVVPSTLQLCIALARDTLLYDIQLETHKEGDV